MMTCRCDLSLPTFIRLLVQIRINTDCSECDQTDRNVEVGLKSFQKVFQAAVN